MKTPVWAEKALLLTESFPELVITLCLHLLPFSEESLMSHLLMSHLPLRTGLSVCTWRCKQETELVHHQSKV